MATNWESIGKMYKSRLNKILKEKRPYIYGNAIAMLYILDAVREYCDDKGIQVFTSHGTLCISVEGGISEVFIYSHDIGEYHLHLENEDMTVLQEVVVAPEKVVDTVKQLAEVSRSSNMQISRENDRKG